MAAGTKLIAENRKARFNYELSEFTEAGIVLTGTEVKSLRNGKVSLGEAYCTVEGGELWLVNSHIPEYRHGNLFNHEPRRRRKLLLHKGELRRLYGKLKERGLTLVPTRMYFKGGMVKVEIALARGRKKHDKREVIKERDVRRDMDREMRT